MSKSIEQRVNEMIAQGITHTFIYDGYQKHEGLESIHHGTVVDLYYMDKKLEAEKNKEWWSHYYPAHSLDGVTKQELWECVKIYAKQHDDNPVIRVTDGEGNTRVVKL